ncbi:coiled-coil domain-containing protein 8 homolog [Schistocerca piceifrons]|uniref:coiled-coil domain-containing protein 8 homolog n=1 Tax=Schistocerca piceifrons TaxID=274613 RepID=UPI001F5E4425|nr:coiled-coil domain-containing protein 8 homolog [Schistocerca piceifrons]
MHGRTARRCSSHRSEGAGCRIFLEPAGPARRWPAFIALIPPKCRPAALPPETMAAPRITAVACPAHKTDEGPRGRRLLSPRAAAAGGATDSSAESSPVPRSIVCPAGGPGIASFPPQLRRSETDVAKRAPLYIRSLQRSRVTRSARPPTEPASAAAPYLSERTARRKSGGHPAAEIHLFKSSSGVRRPVKWLPAEFHSPPATAERAGSSESSRPADPSSATCRGPPLKRARRGGSFTVSTLFRPTVK